MVVHGDACAPNTLISLAGEWVGHVDFGDLAVGDRWADLAIASLSLDWNFGEGHLHQEQLLEAMSELARRHGLQRVVAPVRPSSKHLYPLTPIERYVTWRREDGQLLDPWMRVHERLGARVATPLPESLRITGTVAEWESWTQMAFPESGTYVFPEGLATLDVDREADRGSYWEPNVWMIHPELG